MKETARLAGELRAVFFNGNWTASNLRSQVQDISLDEATARLGQHHSILALVYHIAYYVRAILGVLQGGPLDARDRYSFDHPEIKTAEEWEAFLEAVWKDADQLADCVAQLPAAKLDALFVEEKYGDIRKNLRGLIEHTYYHLGQVALLKKLLRTGDRK